MLYLITMSKFEKNTYISFKISYFKYVDQIRSKQHGQVWHLSQQLIKVQLFLTYNNDDQLCSELYLLYVHVLFINNTTSMATGTGSQVKDSSDWWSFRTAHNTERLSCSFSLDGCALLNLSLPTGGFCAESFLLQCLCTVTRLYIVSSPPTPPLKLGGGFLFLKFGQRGIMKNCPEIGG